MPFAYTYFFDSSQFLLLFSYTHIIFDSAKSYFEPSLIKHEFAMRIKLTLQPQEKSCTIPINYQYPLSAAIYKILYSASSEYANFLHEKGYISEKGKPLKLFTFSYLFIPKVSFKNNMLLMYGAPPCTLFVSSPLIEDFIQNFVVGLFTNQEIVIGNKQTVGRFIIKQVESITTPEFSESENFKCLSPFVLSTMKIKKNKLMPHYYRPDDPELEDAIRQNLIQKYQTVFKKPPENENLKFKLDKNFVVRKGGFGKISKLITIKESNENEQTKIKAIFSPFNLSGSTELMKIAWEAGVGNYCSQGFGMVENAKKKSKKM